MWLVLQVISHDVVHIAVSLGEHAPVGDPIILGESILAVPQAVHEPIVCLRVVVQDDQESLPTRFCDHGIKNLQRSLAS